MSTLRTYNLQNPDSASVNIELTSDGGAVAAGILTTSQLNVGTGGTVITTTAGGDINIDSGGVYYDASNNRFGIGTATPGEELQIGSTTSASSTSPVTLSLGGQYTPQASISQSNLKLKVYDASTDTAGFTAGLEGLSYVGSKLGQHIWYRADGSGTLSESFRSDTGGRLLVGATSYSGNATITAQGHSGDSNGPAHLLLKTGTTSPASGADLGYLFFCDANTSGGFGAWILGQRDGGTWTSGSSMPGRLVFSTTADGASSPTERMRVDSAGRVTMPYQPAFCARNAGGATLSGDIALNTIIFNNGGHYSTSTGNFTAPVAGVYYFSFTGFTQNNSSGSADISIYKNGSLVVRTYSSEAVNVYRPFAVDCLVYLNVNDTVRPNSGIDLHGNITPNFSGFLIG